MKVLTLFIVFVICLALYMTVYFIVRWLIHTAQRWIDKKVQVPTPARTAVRESVRCPPEEIRPSTVKGSCGISGCKIKHTHSHVVDLVRRLRE